MGGWLDEDFLTDIERIRAEVEASPEQKAAILGTKVAREEELLRAQADKLAEQVALSEVETLAAATAAHDARRC